MERKRYSAEFKIQAVRLANHPDDQMQDVALKDVRIFARCHRV